MPTPLHPPDNACLAFPDQREVIAEDVRRFRSLPPPDRWRELFAMQRWGARLVESSPRRDSIRTLETHEEEKWQAIQRNLFARHGD
jgi:hypothetical protein